MNAIATTAADTLQTKTNAPFGIRFIAFLGGAVVYFALTTYNAWPNIDAAWNGHDGKAAAMVFVQFTFAFIVAISSVASAHEKGGQVAVIVFMLVNGYFAYDASSHRHDDAHTASSQRTIIEKELTEKTTKKKALGDDFERVSEKQVEEAEHKRDAAEKSEKGCRVCAKTKAAQKEVDRLVPLQTKTKEAADLDKEISRLNAELKGLKATGDSDNSLASMAPGADAATISTAITLLIALGIELANKYGPYWTFRFLVCGLGYPQSSVYERRKAEKAAEKARKAREAAEAEERKREAEARFAAEFEARAKAEAEEKAKATRAEKRAEAKTREKGDPETVKRYINSNKVQHLPACAATLSGVHKDYAADCRAHGETPVAGGRWFADELRKLGLDVREDGEGSRRYRVYGLALAPVESSAKSGLRIVSSR